MNFCVVFIQSFLSQSPAVMWALKTWASGAVEVPTHQTVSFLPLGIECHLPPDFIAKSVKMAWNIVVVQQIDAGYLSLWPNSLISGKIF